ncbi:uncharacterized protein LOC127425191 isoform X1 [Myxocyprinus asiaticus]|uniref:uncharacterized protein LOC127425191 isoform X1 n=1 Tax=Myxocyprinus asiaticus TaxID=70543 RepID=UPI0022216842|nr:uncharacterized protein LOC127425191 isoform X1 [Myxocyprinus asiaticus]
MLNVPSRPAHMHTCERDTEREGGSALILLENHTKQKRTFRGERPNSLLGSDPGIDGPDGAHGHRGVCYMWGERGADKKCSFCKMVIYCGQVCQRLHWFTHKRQCRALVQQKEARHNSPPKLRELFTNVKVQDISRFPKE